MTSLHPIAARPRSVPAGLLFALVAAGVYAASLALAPRLPLAPHASAVAIGMTLDLVVVVPAAFYYWMIRRRGWPLVTLVPVLALSVAAASRVLPAEHQSALRVAGALVIPVELGLVSWIAWRASRAIREARLGADLDPLERIRRATSIVVSGERLAAVIASEAAVLAFSLASWRARPHVPANAVGVAHHRRGNHGEIVAVLLLLMAAEGCAAHFLLHGWSPLVAWILTIGTIYGALFIVADYRATVLRPILLTRDAVVLRAGLRWALRVPREMIAAVSREKPDCARECLDLTFFGSPVRWIVLAEPILAEGPYGLRRAVRAIGVAPDTAEDAFDHLVPVTPPTPKEDS